MKKAFCMLLAMALCLCCALPAAAWAQDGVYTVSTISELRELAAKVNNGNDFSGVTVELAADLTDNRAVVNGLGELLEGLHTAWTPIGTAEHPFRGSFNGKGHVISGLFVDDTGADFQGLFGVLSGAAVYNVTVKDSYFNTRDHAGAIAGFAKDGTIISTCHNDGTVVNTANRAGGIVGWTDNSDVYNCSGNGYCYSKRCSGGIVGDVYSKGKIYNCYYAGDVKGSDLAGGITGGSTSADIQNCISVGEVSMYMIAGGGGSRTLTNCFALQNDQVNVGKTIGSANKTTKTFSGPGGELNEPVEYNGATYTTALSALNAWVDDHRDNEEKIYYSTWKQRDLYPYLADGVISAPRTSFGSEADTWAVDELEIAYRLNLVPDILVGEDLTRNISRLEFAAVAVRTFEALSGTKAVPIINNPFVDTDDLEVLKAYGIGAINGVSEREFAPNTLLNREQCAVMLTRVFKRVAIAGWTLQNDSDGLLDYAMPALFADDGDISDWARDSVYFMASNGIINGVSGNRFAPKNTTTAEEAEGYANATREQALAIAVRMVQKLG